MERLSELQTLVAIVEGGSLSAAARRLGRSPPVITRILADLEQRVGTTLVERSTRRCAPTAAGSRLVAQARGIVSAYDDAILEAADDASQPAGILRLSAPTVLGRGSIAPALRSFLQAQPRISIDFQLSDRVVDLLEDDFDLAIRIGSTAREREFAKTLGGLRVMVVGSPAYLAEHGVPLTPSAVADHRIIQHSRAGLEAPLAFLDRGRTVEVRGQARFCVNEPSVAIAAACAGDGLVRVLSHQVSQELREGSLEPVLEAFEPEPKPVSLIWPASRDRWRRMRLLVAHLAENIDLNT